MAFQEEFIQSRNQELVEYMQSSRLFSHVPLGLLEGLVPLSELRVYDPGDDILTEGQENDQVFFLIRGTVQIYSGGEYILELKRQGDIFGEMSVISSKPASATVAAKTRVQVFTLRGRNIGKYTDIDVERINHILYRLFAAVLTDKLALTTYKARQYEVVNIYLNKTQVALAEKHSQMTREKQAALETSITKAKFIESLSAELQTPLINLIKLAEEVGEHAVTDEQYGRAQRMAQTSRGVLGLLQDVLEYSDVGKKGALAEAQPYDLLGMVLSVKEQVDALSHTHNIPFNIKLSLESVSRIFGDQPQCKRLLYRVLHHAFLASEQGTVGLEVSSFSGDGGDEILFEVKTNWPIELSENPNDLFIPFSRARSKDGESTGLDLAIAKKQVESMDGRIWFNPGLGKQSSVFLSLPVNPLPPINLQASVMPESMTLLYYEPNLKDAGAFVSLIEEWKIAVYVVCDMEALQSAVFSSETYNVLVVSDSTESDEAIQISRDLLASKKGQDLPTVWLQGYKEDQVKRDSTPLSRVVYTPIRRRSLHQNIVELLSLVQGPSKPTEYLAKQYPLHILVAEDNQVLQNKLKTHLVNMGYSPDTVGDGAKALNKCQEYTYDVVFLDAHMPKVNGVKVAQLLKETFGDACPHLIGLCHETDDEKLAESTNMEFDEVLSKPISVHQLQEHLKTYGQTIFKIIPNPGTNS